MDPVTLIVVPGLIGGLLVAAVMVAWQRRHPNPPRLSPHWAESGPPPADVINSARIPVAGIGGLGMVAMAVVVALNVPSIRASMMAGLTLGLLFALALILLRRHSGSMPSSGRHPGAHGMLPLESPPPRRRDPDDGGAAVRIGLAPAIR